MAKRTLRRRGEAFFAYTTALRAYQHAREVRRQLKAEQYVQ